MGLTARIAMALTATLTAAQDLSTSQSPTAVRRTQDFANGAGANQANKIYSDRNTVLAGDANDLDLNGGGLVDALGAALAFTKIKALMIVAAATNTDNISVGAQGVADVLFPAGDLLIAPGGMFVLTAPTAAGITVTPGTADVLRIGNGGADDGIYDIVIIGA